MTTPGPAKEKSRPLYPGGFLLSAWNWFAAPLGAAPDAQGRRRRLLAWLLLPVFLLTLVVLVDALAFNRPESPRREVYIPLMLALEVLLVLAYVLNNARRSRWAAVLTVLAAVIGPWGAAAFDPSVLQGDPVPLAFTSVSVLLCSVLLSPVATAALAVAQMLVLLGMSVLASEVSGIDWPSLLTLVFITSALSIVFAIISRDDLKQIDRQTRELARSEAALRELSVRDHLTGLFNRRYMEESLDREIRRSLRSHYSIGVLLIDVDQFKGVNDQWGHAAGDLLLRELGTLFRAHIRGGDIACRYGGDEFVIILPEASRHATRQRAERLREAVSQLELPDPGFSLGALTISVGVAVYPQHASTRDLLLRSADQALYRAKVSGRNQVAMAERLGDVARLD